jgi:hypothetical protein
VFRSFRQCNCSVFKTPADFWSSTFVIRLKTFGLMLISLIQAPLVKQNLVVEKKTDFPSYSLWAKNDQRDLKTKILNIMYNIVFVQYIESARASHGLGGLLVIGFMLFCLLHTTFDTEVVLDIIDSITWIQDFKVIYEHKRQDQSGRQSISKWNRWFGNKRSSGFFQHF